MTQTLDRLFAHAQNQPNKVAVIDGEDAFTYDDFAQQLCRFSTKLKEFNLAKGDIVAVEWFRMYPHWLFLLVCEIHGFRSLSFGREDLDNINDILKTHATLVIASAPIEGVSIDKTYLFSSDEYHHINQITPTDTKPISILNPTDPMRLQCSSGTTGSPKFMERSLALHNFRTSQFQDKEIYTEQSRLLLAYTFAVQAVYGRATACLEAGGTIIHPSNLPLENYLIKYQATHTALLPSTLRQLLSFLPDTFQKPQSFTLSTFGGAIPQIMRDMTSNRLTDNIIESYGTNETGSICTMKDNGIGEILPDVEVEIVDDANTSIMNQTGKIRIRGKGLVQGYLFDTDRHADKFKDGWFYPGDVGLKPDKNHLKLQGRLDDLINIGGIKRSLIELEDYIRPNIKADDFCLCETIDAHEIQTIWLCIVPNAQTNTKEIHDIAQPIIQNSLGNIILKALPKIPRSSTQKVKRQELAALLSNKTTT